ncbi:MAG: ATP-dependent DNA helicase RecG [Candidatus Binatia bacterium]|nr:MAG: ATP-dependent DNA helicase RecG [Candidatus Binatia bacterium]
MVTPLPEAIRTDLRALLRAFRPPLEFLSLASPDTARRTSFPVASFREKCRAVENALPEELRTSLGRLLRELDELARVAPAEKGSRARHCLEMVESLEKALSPAPAYRRSVERIEERLEALSRSVQFVRGVGPRRADALRKLGIATVEDLLYHLPFRYEDRRHLARARDVRPGDVVTLRGKLVHLAERVVGRARRKILEGVLRDESGLLPLTWYNQVAYFRTRLRPGTEYFVHGRVEYGAGGVRIVHPEMEPVEGAETLGILPVYTKPSTLSVAAMRKLLGRAVRDWSETVPSALPEEVAARYRLLDLPTALREVHLPDPRSDAERLGDFRSEAHRSIVFDELFFLQLGMLLRRRAYAAEPGLAMPDRGTWTRRLAEDLPFPLTGAQKRALAEIYEDMARPAPMHRLLQGDVGSGKTIVALFAALRAIENGYQAAFMAPTELLAEQHYRTVAPFLERLGLRAVLLTGETSRKEKEATLAGLESGDIHLVVGTHALIQEGVRFRALGLGVIDEQHRFGVLQRAALRRLGTPDILLLTATPIPRTLALTLYGDLDLSFLDEMPAGRQQVRTLLFPESRRPEVYDLVRRELDLGHQGYVVYPRIEEAEDPNVRDATTMARELARTVFASYRVGLLHGKMRPEEKDAVMRRFRDGDVQLLVATTVVEVGIDVPNATVMVVENAERFGLAQLHQLRGRVGRGTAPSLCLLVASFARSDTARERLAVLGRSYDGLAIAEADLRLRGPGDFLGTRQSGLPDFRVANLVRDSSILKEAREAAEAWLEKDPDLSSPESAPLRAILRRRWSGRLELARTG